MIIESIIVGGITKRNFIKKKKHPNQSPKIHGEAEEKSMRDTKNAWTEVREGQEKKAVKWNPRE